jgi:transposase-like protein
MILEGTSQLDAARHVGMDRQTLRDWVQVHQQTKPVDLAARKVDKPKPDEPEPKRLWHRHPTPR